MIKLNHSYVFIIWGFGVSSSYNFNEIDVGHSDKYMAKLKLLIL